MDTTHQQPLDDSSPLRVRRGRVESVDLYEIKDTELDALEKGTPADLQLNFAIFSLSISFSAIATLVSATFSVRAVEMAFTVAAVAGFLFGAYLLVSWWGTRSETRELCKTIRQRIPADAVIPEDDEEGEESEELWAPNSVAADLGAVSAPPRG